MDEKVLIKSQRYNIKKLFIYYSTNKYLKFWKAPLELQAQSFKKPSAKRLSKKGSIINNKKYKQA